MIEGKYIRSWNKTLSKITSNLNNMKIRKKLLVVYLLVGFIPTLFLGAFLLYTTHHNLLEQQKILVQAENKRVHNIIFDITYLCMNISKSVQSDSALDNLIARNFQTDEEVYDAYRNITTLDSFASNYTEISSIKLYVNNKTLITNDKIVVIDKDIENTSWYQQAVNSSGEVIWMYNSNMDNKYSYLYLVRMIKVPKSDNFAILVIGISNNYFSSVIESKKTSTLIVLNNKTIIFSDNAKEIGNSLFIKTLENNNWKEPAYITSYKGNDVLVYCSSMRGIYSNDTFQAVTITNALPSIRKTVFLIFCIILISLLIPLLMVVVFSNSYSRRVLIVREEMHKISQGNLNILDNFAGKDELGELFQDMKFTIESIQNLNKEIYKEKITKKNLENYQQKMQFELLVSQINPHFLFNTLESIRMHAALNGQNDLTFIIGELGRLMRYTLETKNKMVSIESELDYIKAYLEIQHFRFGDKIKYQIHISPKINTKTDKIMPLLLQPIVENAMIHGFKKKKENGMIDINVMRREQELHISVQDNGMGMSAQKLNEVFQHIHCSHEEQTENSIGIRNVQQRIKFYYGDTYGLSISSTEKIGTIVTIILPLERENNNESIIY